MYMRTTQQPNNHSSQSVMMLKQTLESQAMWSPSIMPSHSLITPSCISEKYCSFFFHFDSLRICCWLSFPFRVLSVSLSFLYLSCKSALRISKQIGLPRTSSLYVFFLSLHSFNNRAYTVNSHSTLWHRSSQKCSFQFPFHSQKITNKMERKNKKRKQIPKHIALNIDPMFYVYLFIQKDGIFRTLTAKRSEFSKHSVNSVHFWMINFVVEVDAYTHRYAVFFLFCIRASKVGG